MNTPDTEVCEICHGFGDNGADDAQCLNCGGSGKCDTTPDIEKEVKQFEEFLCFINDCPIQADGKEVVDYFRNALTSIITRYKNELLELEKTK